MTSEERPSEAPGSEGRGSEEGPPEQHRLHIAAVFAGAFDQLRGLVIPIVVIAVLGGGGGSESLVRAAVYAGIGIVGTTTWAAIGWSTTRWYIAGGSVHLRKGVLSENITSIPLERVQAVDTVRGPVQRLFGVVEVHVQTAGGGRAAEIVLSAVSEAEAEELREAVRQAGSELAVEDAERPAALEWRLPGRSLVLAAATSGSLAVLLPFVAAAGQFGDDLAGPDAAQRLAPSSPQEALRDVGLIIVAAWILSFVGTLVAFAGFRMARDGNRIRIHRGIVQRREASVPVARVHAVRVIEGPLREPFGLAQIRIDSAGYAKEPASAQTLFPLVRRREAAELIARFLPEFDGNLDELERVPRSAMRRYVLPLAWPGLAAGIIVALFAGPIGLLAATAIVPGALLGLARYRAAGYRLDDKGVVIRARRLARTTAVADPTRLQAVNVSANPLQRRARLATLALDIASRRRLRVKHLSAPAADDLFAELGQRALGPAR
jgi:putative membrane protein